MVDIFLSDSVNNKFRLGSSHFPQRLCCTTQWKAGPGVLHHVTLFSVSLPYRLILLIYSITYYLLLSS